MKTVKEIGELLFEAETEPMNEDMTAIFMILSVQEGQELPRPVLESFGFQLISKRLEATYSESIATDSVIGVFALISDRPGTAVLYAAAIAAMFAKVGHQVTMNDMVEFFPLGFPVEKELERIWDAQKIGGANLVDTRAAWRLEEVH